MVDAAPSPPPANLDRDNTLLQAAALAEHLHHAGVSFLPKPNADRVAELGSWFVQSAAASGVAATPLVDEKPVVSSPPVTAVQPGVAAGPASEPAAKQLFSAENGAKSYSQEALPIDQRTVQLELLANTVAACTKCPELVRCRTQTVFGEGNPAARFAFFGEGPGAEEDKTGRAFVGKAGQLLTKMIEACKLQREEVYIFNTVKCRPPANRNPDLLEVENCRHYFETQLEIIRPEYIVCLGAISSQALLHSKLPIGKLRGKFHRYFGSKVVATYHPAYLLRNPAAKKAAWDDLQMMLHDAGIKLK